MTEDRSARRRKATWLAGVLLIAAALRLWRLEDNGFGDEYYAAGVRSMLQSAHLFFYGAFDPGGFLSLDKPPVALWIQTVFAWILGFGGWSLHLPQALAGVASTALLYRLVRRPYGQAAGLVAALLLALAPIAVAIDRSNNVDSWLIFFLLLAALAALRGRGRSLVASMALLGIAFNVKMLAALVCGPALLAAWLLAGTLGWRRRIGWMAAAGATLVVVSMSWPIAFDLTPKDQRPYAGSTTDNSMLELIVVHNGLERFALRSSTRPTPNQALGLPGFELYDAVPTGPLRLATPILAAQFAWLLPLGVLALVLGRGRDRDRRDASLALWGVWALAYGVVYSAAGGIFHLYYLSTLTPPLAALAAIGAVQLWHRGPAYLALGVALCAAWQFYLTSATLGWDWLWLGIPLVALCAGTTTLWRPGRPAAVLGGIALLALPLAWSLSPIFSPGSLILPSSSLPRWLGLDDGRGPLLSGNFPPPTEDTKLEQFLLAHRGGARFLAATPNTRLAAPIIIDTGQPVMAVGGYFGIDPTLTVDAFAEKVARGEVRYMMLGRRRGSPIALWTIAHGHKVDDALWRFWPSDPYRPLAVYDLKPD